MIRLRVTDLEAFRHWKASEDSTLEDLVQRLRHEDPPTPEMRAGKAFAKLLEHTRAGRSLHVEEQDGWEFFFDLETEVALPSVRELRGEMVVDTPSGPVTLVGQVDGYDGAVYDQKLTERVDPEQYLDSLQWRAYLVMFGAREFVYDLFRAKYERTEDDEPTGKIVVDEHHRLKFYAYPLMRSDVERAVCELAEVVTTYVGHESRVG